MSVRFIVKVTLRFCYPIHTIYSYANVPVANQKEYRVNSILTIVDPTKHKIVFVHNGCNYICYLNVQFGFMDTHLQSSKSREVAAQH